MMRFYKNPAHRYYAGVDLHARSMYVCILDQQGNILVHQNLRADPKLFLQTIAPYRDGLVVGAECMFAWYWLADLCQDEHLPFVLGHALAIKAIHGGKTKNDKLDSHTLGDLLRGGNFPQAYVYPRGMRETRDLLRRRCFMVRQRALLIAHIQNEASQYNLPAFAKKLTYAANRQELDVAGHFSHPSVKRSVQADLALIDAYDAQIGELELYLQRHAKIDDGDTYHRLLSIPGVGKILALMLLYEIHDIARFPDVGDFLSYARLVRGSHESAGKKKAAPGKKMGNAHLKWAFGEAACLLVRHCERGKAWMNRYEKKHGKAKSLATLSAKLGRTVYHLWRKRVVFDEARLFAR
jgi:transposase